MRNVAIPCVALVVDDNPEIVRFVTRVLGGDGYEVVTASGGDEALAKFAKCNPDLLIADLSMPGISGDQLFREVQARYPGFPCVFLTGNSSIDKAVELMRAGAFDYITKPVQPDVFQVRMQAVRDRIGLHREVESLRSLCEPVTGTGAFVVGADAGMLALVKRIALVARTNAPVVISGESGTGKEVFARAIHRASQRAAAPFVAVNTGAIPITLWESEFFGHVKGAFTDAKHASAGLIASAEGGTLFLDEISETPIPAQSKLLRFLQEREYRPLGAKQNVSANVRVICASNRDLGQMVAAGELREDLYYRLHVVPVHVPALRERRGDIPLLAQHFLERYAMDFDVPVRAFTPSALMKLTRFAWPGNIRQLENVIQQAVAVATAPILTADDLAIADDDYLPAEGVRPAERPAGTEALPPPLMEARRHASDAFERDYLRAVLALTEGNISRAAELSAVPRKTLWRLLKKHNIEAVRDGIVSKPGRPRAES